MTQQWTWSREKGGRRHRCLVRLTDREMLKLAEEAVAANTGHSAIIRRALLEYLERLEAERKAEAA